MTSYQTVVYGHLCDIFNKKLLVTDEVVLFVENEIFRKWVVELSLNHGYIPVFSHQQNKHVIVTFIKKFIPC